MTLDKKPMVAFVLDGGYKSHWDNVSIFEDRGVVCSFTVSDCYLDITNYMSYSQLLDLQSRGFEISNHAFSYIRNTGTVWEQSQQEIEQNYAILRSKGLDIDGFITPSSAISNMDRIKIIRRHHKYAFTIAKACFGADAVYSETDSTTVYQLFRSECSNLVNAKLTIDAIVASCGLTVFYSHDIDVEGSVSSTDLAALIDYAQLQGVAIIAPKVLAEEFARRKAQNCYKPIDVFAPQNLFSGTFYMGNISNVSLTRSTVGNNNSFVISAGNVGDVVLADTNNNHIASALNQEYVFQIEASSNVKKIDGLTVGIRVHRASDNSIVCAKESLEVQIDGWSRKYKISTGNITMNEPFYFNLFYRLKNVGAENMTVNINNPYLYQGNISFIF